MGHILGLTLKRICAVSYSRRFETIILVLRQYENRELSEPLVETYSILVIGTTDLKILYCRDDFNQFVCVDVSNCIQRLRCDGLRIVCGGTCGVRRMSAINRKYL